VGRTERACWRPIPDTPFDPFAGPILLLAPGAVNGSDPGVQTGGTLRACLDPLPRAAIEKATAGQSPPDNGGLIAHRSAEQDRSRPAYRRLRPGKDRSNHVRSQRRCRPVGRADLRYQQLAPRDRRDLPAASRDLPHHLRRTFRHRGRPQRRTARPLGHTRRGGRSLADLAGSRWDRHLPVPHRTRPTS